jgi:radical SAM/Cys-rich protein
MMDLETADRVIGLLKDYSFKVLDVTGGAPELNPHFRHIVSEARKLGRHVIVRCNLTIFFEEGMEDLLEFYRQHGVEVIASLPYYLEESVDRVRGRGTFQKSIRALQMLNSVGFGKETSDLKLNLVFNPQGAFLPPSQAELEKKYKGELMERFGISFSNLFTFTNIPVGRFGDFLRRTKNLDKYMEKLSGAFNPCTLDGIMCRHLISIGWDGRLYDCDFNQMIGLGLMDEYPHDIRDFDISSLSSREIALGDHCYGCTAGQGST